MYCMLGNIAFEPVDITAFDESHSAEFAEHAVLKGKPRLQAMGEKLNELNFAIRLHHHLGGVESRYQALLSAKAQQEALALVWGRGKYKGNYVITSLSSTTLFSDAQGNALARELSIGLKEFVGDSQGGLLGEALNFGSNTLLGSILPSGVVSVLSTVKNAVNRGVTLYQQGKRMVDEVKNTVAVMRQLANDPATALAYLPSTLSHLNFASASFAEATGLTDLLGGLNKILPSAVVFSQELGSIYQDVQTMQSHFQQASPENAWANWFTTADNALAEVSERFDNLAKPVAEMTAWIALRTDETEPNQAENQAENREESNEPTNLS